MRSVDGWSIEGRVGCHLSPVRKRRDVGVRRGFPSPRPAGMDASTRKWTEIGPVTAMFGRAPLDDASPCARRPDKKSGMPAETLSSEIYIPSRTHLAELLKAEEEEAVLVLGPGNACGKRRDENIRISTRSAPRVTARSSLAESRADQMRSGGFGKKRTNRGKLPGKRAHPSCALWSARPRNPTDGRRPWSEEEPV